MAGYSQPAEGSSEQYRNPALSEPYGYDASDAYAGKARKRYRYHDRGDGMYMAARQLGERPHLVLSGKCVPSEPADAQRGIAMCQAYSESFAPCRHAGRSNVKYVGTYARGWDYHLWARGALTHRRS